MQGVGLMVIDIHLAQDGISLVSRGLCVVGRRPND